MLFCKQHYGKSLDIPDWRCYLQTPLRSLLLKKWDISVEKRANRHASNESEISHIFILTMLTTCLH